MVTRSYLREHPDRIVRFLKAYIEGAQKAFGDATWAKEVIAKRFKTNDPKVIDATYHDYAAMTARDLTPSTDGARSVLAQLKAINLAVGSDNVADYLDLSFIDKLNALAKTTGNNVQRHMCMLRAAEFRALSPIHAWAIRLQPRVIFLARDNVSLTRELRNPE